MLGVLCARTKPWILSSISSFLHTSASHHHRRLLPESPRFSGAPLSRQRRHHSSACTLRVSGECGGVASIWHAILPSGDGVNLRRPAIHYHHHELRKGDGSWNVAWDARPARWLHGVDSAWLLFGVCACLSPVGLVDANAEGLESEERTDGCDPSGLRLVSEKEDQSSADYKVKGVLADGRCLFRAIAHCACLRKGEQAPDENRQRELADELRAQVVNELLKRREETEWFIEGDFDAYVERLQHPYVWGGEPELLMASHVLKTPISVFMKDRSSGSLLKIAKYGEEYWKDDEAPINVLFHGYGHYEILETSDQSFQKMNT